ncbi:MAG TPA: glycosyltransferase [Pseudomonadales bacterium]|nr:glycosyltransferase [Pseudomonadales bacterium]
METEQQKILIIGSVWPEPRSSAAGSHMLQIIEQLLLDGCIITFASAAAPGETRADLVALGIREHVIALNCTSFDTWVHALDPDIVLFDRFMTEEQFGWRVEEQCPQALRVLETSDLHCLREARQQLLKTPGGLYQTMAQQDISMREIAAIFRCDLSLMISRVEIDILVREFSVPDYLLCHCPFLLDMPDAKKWRSYEQREHFVTIGNFLHAPNWDAVQQLKKSIWPIIRSQLPQAQLHIYGAYAPQKACELHNAREGFLVHGWTEDALDVIQRARVCLAPLRFGAGIKGKLADAMLTGTPSITTSIGAESMHDDLPWPGLIADEARAFADAAVSVYQDQTLWSQSQRNIMPVLQQCFNKTEFGAALITQLEQANEQIGQHRLQNVVGRMLRHHQHKSTHYMARWIEEKNKNRN